MIALDLGPVGDPAAQLLSQQTRCKAKIQYSIFEAVMVNKEVEVALEANSFPKFYHFHNSRHRICREQSKQKVASHCTKTMVSMVIKHSPIAMQALTVLSAKRVQSVLLNQHSASKNACLAKTSQKTLSIQTQVLNHRSVHTNVCPTLLKR